MKDEGRIKRSGVFSSGRIGVESAIQLRRPHSAPFPASKTKTSDNLPEPDVLAQEIVDDLEAALEQFRKIANDFDGRRKMKRKFSVFHLRRFS